MADCSGLGGEVKQVRGSSRSNAGYGLFRFDVVENPDLLSNHVVKAALKSVFRNLFLLACTSKAE
jgi:hypothetical protein